MDRITLSHGSGGAQMHNLIDSVFMKKFANPILKQKRDSAILKIGSEKIAFTTDSYVVDPIFFPGGDIGSLAIHGTVNDLAVCGATPLYISAAAVIEEGFDRSALERIASSMAKAAKRAGVTIVTGDTKVVAKGACDKIFINTSGIGRMNRPELSISDIRSGDRVIVSGPIGDHAVSVLSKREGFDFITNVRSDSTPLNALIASLSRVSRGVVFMRDPTRGGVATTLNELVVGRSFGITLDEKALPVRPGVREACEMLGFEPLYLACEGRVIVIARQEYAARILGIMRRDPLGRLAREIGIVSREYPARVVLNTSIGGKRTVEMLTGEQLPRIC